MSAADRQRFRALYASTFVDIYAYVRRRVDANVAADAVAETFLIAWRRLDVVPSDETARLWLFGVARRVLANEWRGQRRRSRLFDRLVATISAVGPPVDDSFREHADVRDALTSLAELDADILRLAYWEELTPAEIAVVLEMKPATVRSRLTRARQRFAVAYAERSGVQRSAADGHGEVDERPLVAEQEEQR